MKHLFPALEARYNASPELVRIGFQLVRPTDESPQNVPGRYVIVDGRMEEAPDDFAVDTERWILDFKLIGQSVRPDDAASWLEEMTKMFEDAVVISPASAFDWNGSRVLTKAGPMLEGHMYTAECSVEAYITLTINNPQFRGR